MVAASRALVRQACKLPELVRAKIGAYVLALKELEAAGTCNPSTPMDCRQLAKVHRRVSLQGRAQRQAAAAAPYCVLLDLADLAATPGQLDACLAWLRTVTVTMLQLGTPGEAFVLWRVQELATRLAPAACDAVRQLAVAAEQLGDCFDAESLRGFSQLEHLELHRFVSADLAALPPSVHSVSMALPSARDALLRVLNNSRHLQAGHSAGPLAVCEAQDAVEQRQAGVTFELPADEVVTPAALLGALPQQALLVPATHHRLPHHAKRTQQAQHSGVGGWWSTEECGLFYPGFIPDPEPIQQQTPPPEKQLGPAYMPQQPPSPAPGLGEQHTYVPLAVTPIVFAAPGALMFRGMEEQQQIAEDLGRTLRRRLEALVRLGTLRPLHRSPQHMLERVSIVAEGLDIALDTSMLTRSTRQLAVQADRLHLVAQRQAGARPLPPPSRRRRRQQHSVQQRQSPQEQREAQRCLSGLLAALDSGGMQQAELAAALFVIELRSSGSGAARGAAAAVSAAAAGAAGAAAGVSQRMASTLTTSQLFGLLSSCSAAAPGISARRGGQPGSSCKASQQHQPLLRGPPPPLLLKRKVHWTVRAGKTATDAARLALLADLFLCGVVPFLAQGGAAVSSFASRRS